MFICFYRCQTPSHQNVFPYIVIESFGAIAVSCGYLLCHLVGADLSLVFTVGVASGTNPALSKDAIMAPLTNYKARQCWVTTERILLCFAVRATTNYIRHISYYCDKITNKRNLWNEWSILAHSKTAHSNVSGKAWSERGMRQLVTSCPLSGKGGAGTRFAFYFWKTFYYYIYLFIFSIHLFSS